VPDWLTVPIREQSEGVSRLIRGPITPKLTAGDVVSAAWDLAGYRNAGGSGAMQRAQATPGLRRVYYGYDADHLYVRVESNGDIWRDFVGLYWYTPRGPANRDVRFAETRPDVSPADVGFVWELVVPAGEETPALNRADGQGNWQRTDIAPTVARGSRSAEVRVPRAALGLCPGDYVGLRVTLARDGRLTDVLPLNGHIGFTLA
jgi:hypothetical protein